MLARELEPEIMDDPEESRAYNDMDHAEVNRTFVDDIISAGFIASPTPTEEHPAKVFLDLGTGTALIPIDVLQRGIDCRIVAVDGAISMLELAKINIAIEGWEHRIQLQHGDAKKLEFFDQLFDGVMSNSLIHHLPDPGVGIAEMWRVLKPGGWLFVRDLSRPKDVEDVEHLVAVHAAGEPAGNQQLLRQSLKAALTVSEVQELAAANGLPDDCVRATSDRHWTLSARKPSV